MSDLELAGPPSATLDSSNAADELVALHQLPDAGEIPDDVPLRQLSLEIHPSPDALPMRLWVLAAVLAAECLAIAQLPHPWLKPQQSMAAPIAFGIALLFFGRDKLRAMSLQTVNVNPKILALHCAAIGLIVATGAALLRTPPVAPALGTLALWSWFASILLLVGSLVAALFPLRYLARMARGLREVWIYAGITTVAAMTARTLLRLAWDAPQSRFGHAIQAATFIGVKALLGLFYADVIANPSTAVIGTSRFAVQVAGTCSGIEGLALMLVLTVGWVIFVRRELKLERAIWLVPVALGSVWLLNLIRIAALISIGDAGHADIAVNGFHSEAGWLMFNLTAIAFLLSAQHLACLRQDRPVWAPVATAPRRRDAGTIYLLPFLAIVAASFIAQAASAGFEWLYPLRFPAALLVLWIFRHDYRKMDWRFGWLGPVAGIFVFVLWIALAHMGPMSVPASPLAMQLAQLQPWQRTSWLLVRCMAMVATVPVAEELAFRGYIARRVMAADVETVRFSRLNVLAIMISGAVFGVLHGRAWIAGIAAGVVFALVAKIRGRLGEAVAAHAVANLLLTIWVTTRGDYSIW